MTLHCCCVQAYLNLDTPSLLYAIIAILAVHAHIPSQPRGQCVLCLILVPLLSVRFGHSLHSSIVVYNEAFIRHNFLYQLLCPVLLSCCHVSW